MQDKTWDETVAEAIASGCKVIAPNGGRITCIKADGTCMENPHADHQDYKFPVTAQYTGKDPVKYFDLDIIVGHEKLAKMTDEEIFAMCSEQHALIYTDGSMALTLFECEYFMWSLVYDGELLKSKPTHYRESWKLSKDSIERILNVKSNKG